VVAARAAFTRASAREGEEGLLCWCSQAMCGGALGQARSRGSMAAAAKSYRGAAADRVEP
jgi:hypothetical protein